MNLFCRFLCLLVLFGCATETKKERATPDTDPTAANPTAATCNPTTGMPQALETCSAARPCALSDSSTIAKEIDIPSCSTPSTSYGNKHTYYNDGPAKPLSDLNGLTRYYCEYRPAGTSVSFKRPLVLWFHGGSGNANNVYEFTRLRDKAPTYDLSNDISRPGFVLVSIQGRYLHWPTTEIKHNTHHDFYYRDFNSPSKNPDIDFADRVIDKLVGEGVIDPNRIYAMGISNGGFFSQLYAIARYSTRTRAGNRIAAAAIYSAADPFQSPNFDQNPSCQLNPYPKSVVPILNFSRNCDLITCNQSQMDRFRSEGQPLLAPGFVVENWVGEVATKVQNPNYFWQRINASSQKVSTCLTQSLCSYALGVVNHIHWPDGTNDNSGLDHEPELLNFLKNHPR